MYSTVLHPSSNAAQDVFFFCSLKNASEALKIGASDRALHVVQ